MIEKCITTVKNVYSKYFFLSCVTILAAIILPMLVFFPDETVSSISKLSYTCMHLSNCKLIFLLYGAVEKHLSNRSQFKTISDNIVDFSVNFSKDHKTQFYVNIMFFLNVCEFIVVASNCYTMDNFVDQLVYLFFTVILALTAMSMPFLDAPYYFSIRTASRLLIIFAINAFMGPLTPVHSILSCWEIISFTYGTNKIRDIDQLQISGAVDSAQSDSETRDMILKDQLIHKKKSVEYPLIEEECQNCLASNNNGMS